MPGNVNLLIHKRFAIPGTEGYIDMNDDEVVHDMFCMYEGQLVINIKVFNMDIIPVEQPAMLLNRKIDGDHEHIEIQNIQNALAADEQNVHVIDSQDEGYGGESSSDESWKQGFDDDNEDDIGDELMVLSENSSSDESFQNLDDNETGDLIVPDSESEQEMDPLKEVLRNKMWTYNPREDIEFKKGQLFTNVDAFRAALKDYVIQKGFPIKRLKNEKTRCTAICDVDGCSWRIHASPIADSVTFMIKSYNLNTHV